MKSDLILYVIDSPVITQFRFQSHNFIRIIQHHAFWRILYICACTI